MKKISKMKQNFGKQICICTGINLHFHEREEANTLNNPFSNIIKIFKIRQCYVEQVLT